MISVLLPYRDAEETLAEALASVLAERDIPLEILAIDDGSRDGSAASAAAFTDARVTHIRTNGVGIASACAVGMSVARGEIIARMDADDVSLPGRFAATLALLDRVEAAGTCVDPFPVAAVGPGMRRYVDWLNGLLSPEDHARAIFVESPLCNPSVAMRRDAYERVGGYRDVDGPEDYDLFLRMHAAGFCMAKSPHVGLRWRHHDRRMTVRDPRLALDKFVRMKAPYLASHLAGEPFAVWGAGRTGKRLSRALESYGARPSCFVDVDPKKRIARGVPVVAPSACPRDRTIVVAVGDRGARAEVCAHLAALGVERVVCAA